jgi:hypothetical protein
VQRLLRGAPNVQRCGCGNQTDDGKQCSACRAQRQLVQRNGEVCSAEGEVCTADDAAQIAPNPERLARLDELSLTIDTEGEANLRLRAQLDALQQSGPEREELEQALDGGRAHLLDALEERVTLLDEEIASLNTRIGPNPTSSADHPELDALGQELAQREAELRRHLQQLRPLRRWQIRRQIGSIEEQIAQIDAELSTLPPTCDPGDPTGELLLERRAELEQRKVALAARLTGDATEYEQWDARWGAERYGNSPACTSIGEAGCGPTSLAIVMNYLYQEDPESLAASGNFEIVQPPETAEYAADHGRVCNSGTAGDTMISNLPTGFPGFSGRRITLDQSVDQLRSGNLVIFLCKNCVGNNRSGGTKSYGGHFMVLNGVDAAGQSFNVLDPGANEASDIQTISRQELATHTNGFWIVERI